MNAPAMYGLLDIGRHQHRHEGEEQQRDWSDRPSSVEEHEAQAQCCAYGNGSLNEFRQHDTLSPARTI